MEIKKFIASLLPTFERNQLIEDCEMSRKILKKYVEPAFEGAVPFFRSWKFLSPEVSLLLESWDSLVKQRQGNFVQTFARDIPIIEANLEWVEVTAKRLLNDDVVSTGLTYRKAQLIQFAEMLSFTVSYARKFLLFIYLRETMAADPDRASEYEDSMLPAEVEWLKANIVPFCTAFNAATSKTHDVSKKLDTVPDIEITESNMDTVPTTIGMAKIDPLNAGFISPKLNPIFHIRMAVAEYQASRYTAAKDELKLCQLRKLNLEKVKAGKPDAKLQQEIEYTESRIQKLTYKLAKMEKDYA